MTDGIWKTEQYTSCLVLVTEEKLGHRPRSDDDKIGELRNLYDWDGANGNKNFFSSSIFLIFLQAKLQRLASGQKTWVKIRKKAVERRGRENGSEKQKLN